jgi:hypothetical protein
MTIRFSELEMGAGQGDNTSKSRAMVALVALLERIARGEIGVFPE